MTLLKKILFAFGVLALLGSQAVSARMPVETARYFNGPTVSEVTETSARVSLSQAVLNDLTPEEKARVYFEYYQTHQMCIAIYPTPVECQPKKTEVGKTDVVLTNLKANTSYTIAYKMDNTIRCITAPCPGNEFTSQSVEFTTTNTSSASTTATITHNLWLGSHGSEVVTLQTILIQQGYLKSQATGYFGLMTLKAVYMFQRANNISATGYVGPLTRKALTSGNVSSAVGTEERFEGTITAYSQGCFVDGICSISVDGKVIVTTRGWSQEVVGTVIGIPDFGSIANKVGSHAKVYAKKTSDGYTLYGSANYYIQIQ